MKKLALPVIIAAILHYVVISFIIGKPLFIDISSANIKNIDIDLLIEQHKQELGIKYLKNGKNVNAKMLNEMQYNLFGKGISKFSFEAYTNLFRSRIDSKIKNYALREDQIEKLKTLKMIVNINNGNYKVFPNHDFRVGIDELDYYIEDLLKSEHGVILSFLKMYGQFYVIPMIQKQPQALGDKIHNNYFEHSYIYKNRKCYNRFYFDKNLFIYMSCVFTASDNKKQLVNLFKSQYVGKKYLINEFVLYNLNHDFAVKANIEYIKIDGIFLPQIIKITGLPTRTGDDDYFKLNNELYLSNYKIQ